MKLNIVILSAFFAVTAQAGALTDKFKANFINHTSITSDNLDVIYSMTTYAHSIGDGPKSCRSEDVVNPIAASVSVRSHYLRGCGILTTRYNYSLSINDKTNTSYYTYLSLEHKLDVKNIQEKTYSIFELSHDQTVDIKGKNGETLTEWKSRNQINDYSSAFLLIKDLKTGTVHSPLTYFATYPQENKKRIFGFETSSNDFEVRLVVGDTNVSNEFKKIYAEKTVKLSAKELNNVFEKVSIELPEL